MAIASTTMIRMIIITALIINGDNTHHQDHVILPRSFSAINRIPRRLRHPTPPLDEDDVLMSILSTTSIGLGERAVKYQSGISSYYTYLLSIIECTYEVSTRNSSIEP